MENTREISMKYIDTCPTTTGHTNFLEPENDLEYLMKNYKINAMNAQKE